MSTNYKYWAFISYSHADEDKAEYIERIVTKYKLPKTLKQCYIQMPDDLNPIFRDDSGLCAGCVDNSLDDKLKLSKNLIVISTENSVKSDWVDYEIENYKKFNSDCAIIPVIFTEKPILNKLLEKDNLVAIPFTKESEKKSTCRLIASCLGNGIEPYQVQHKISVGKMLRTACLLICLVISCVLLPYKSTKTEISFSDLMKLFEHDSNIQIEDDRSSEENGEKNEYQQQIEALKENSNKHNIHSI